MNAHVTDGAERALDLQDAEAVCDTLREAAAVLQTREGRDGAVQWLPDHGRLLATGDLHDNLRHYRLIMRLAGLDRGSNRHVVLHELIHGEHLIHGTDLSYRTLCRVACAVIAYPTQVHPIIGNHEVSQAYKLRVTKGFGEQVALFDAGLELIFGDNAQVVSDAVDHFMLSMPLVLRSPWGHFVSHSTPGPLQLSGFDTSIFRRSLCAADFAPLSGAAWQMVWGRGQTRESTARFLEMVDARLLICGHALVETGVESRGPQMLVLNSDHEHGAVVPIELDGPPRSAQELAMEALPLRAFQEVE